MIAAGRMTSAAGSGRSAGQARSSRLLHRKHPPAFLRQFRSRLQKKTNHNKPTNKQTKTRYKFGKKTRLFPVRKSIVAQRVCDRVPRNRGSTAIDYSYGKSIIKPRRVANAPAPVLFGGVYRCTLNDRWMSKYRFPEQGVGIIMYRYNTWNRYARC